VKVDNEIILENFVLLLRTIGKIILIKPEYKLLH